MKKGALALAFAALCSLSLSAQVVTVKEKSFDTPEKAFSHFIMALRDADLNEALSACAIDQYGGDFDFRAFTKRLNAMTIPTGPAPSDAEIFKELNRIDQIARLSRGIKFIYYSLLSDETELLSTVIAPDDQRVAAFITALDPRRLNDLKLIHMDAHPLVGNERYRKLALQNALCFGAEDGTERVALLEFEGSFYILGVHLFKYGKYWKIDSLSAPLCNTPSLGLEKCDFAGYESRLQ